MYIHIKKKRTQQRKREIIDLTHIILRTNKNEILTLENPSSLFRACNSLNQLEILKEFNWFLAFKKKILELKYSKSWIFFSFITFK